MKLKINQLARVEWVQHCKTLFNTVSSPLKRLNHQFVCGVFFSTTDCNKESLKGYSLNEVFQMMANESKLINPLGTNRRYIGSQLFLTRNCPDVVNVCFSVRLNSPFLLYIWMKIVEDTWLSGGRCPSVSRGLRFN